MPKLLSHERRQMSRAAAVIRNAFRTSHLRPDNLDPNLRLATGAFLHSYEGEHRFLLSVKKQLNVKGWLSDRQIAAVLNVWREQLLSDPPEQLTLFDPWEHGTLQTGSVGSSSLASPSDFGGSPSDRAFDSDVLFRVVRRTKDFAS